jgi:DNA modification methylase
VSVRILVGDARAVLATLPAESVHCVVTSPPYWGLRDYQLPPTVWGGAEGCAHAWGEPLEKFGGGGQPGDKVRWQHTGAGPNGHPLADAGAVCARCNAWRGALGLEPDPALYVAHLVEVFRAVRRVLRADGTCWVNLGDSYANTGNGGGGGPSASTLGSGDGIPGRGVKQWDQTIRAAKVTPPGLKPKDLIGIPWRVAFALQADGWYLRSEIIWAKPNPMPESVTDRPTKAHEQLFLLAKSPRYFYDGEAIKESGTGRNAGNAGPVKGAGHGDPYFRTREGFAAVADTEWFSRNKRSVWTIPSAPFPEAHFATFPAALVEPCVQAGTSARGACPACGAPWRRAVAHAYDNPGNRTTNGPRSLAQRHETAGFPVRLERRTETLGWAPTCACAPTPVPCVVLDPFAGAGTVGLVADRLGRDAILIELKPEYAAMAERRIREEAPLLTAVAVEGETMEPPPMESGGKALTTPRGAHEGARWNQNQGRGLPRPDGQPWGRAVPPATGNGHGPAAPEQLGLDWSEIARVDV